MTEFAKAEKHRVLPARRLGDTLIVLPTGSMAGYGAGEANREQSRLIRLLAEPGIESLVIDLHDADYFGSEMVGVFVRLQQACRGVTALVGVEHGMRKVLEVMQLNELFSFYRSQRQALKAISRIPLRQRVRERFSGIPVAVQLAATTCTLLLAVWLMWSGGLVYRIVGSPIARDYCTLNDLWADFSRLETVNDPEEELALRQNLNRDLEQLNWKVSMRHSVFGTVGADEKQFQEALESFEGMVQKRRETVDRILFLHQMHCARNSIARRTGLELPKPLQATPADDA